MKLRYIFASHQDLDIVASLNRWLFSKLLDQVRGRSRVKLYSIRTETQYGAGRFARRQAPQVTPRAR
jgi:hypothetical protein